MEACGGVAWVQVMNVREILVSVEVLFGSHLNLCLSIRIKSGGPDVRVDIECIRNDIYSEVNQRMPVNYNQNGVVTGNLNGVCNILVPVAKF